LLVSLVFLLMFLIFLLLAIAYLTLFERHLLSIIQIRLGPNKSFFMALTQPLVDGLKLLSKTRMNLKNRIIRLYLLVPILSFVIMILEWMVLSFQSSFLTMKLAFMIFAFLIGRIVYTMMLSGIFSKNKYSMLGRVRSASQVISYEVGFIIYLFALLSLERSLVLEGKARVLKIFFLIPWLIGVLAETNRIPFDFRESESELISGFNTEYRSFGFVFLFLREYGSILFFSSLTRILFFHRFEWLAFLFILFFLIVIRRIFPRYRYDKLMSLYWITFLPISLFIVLLLL